MAVSTNSEVGSVTHGLLLAVVAAPIYGFLGVSYHRGGSRVRHGRHDLLVFFI